MPAFRPIPSILFAALLPAALASDPGGAAPAPLPSSVFAWSAVTAQPNKNGERRDLFDSATRTLSRLECHATTIRTGLSPHPPHRHPDEELVIVKEGTLEVTINGASRTAGPGSMFFFASGDLHGLRNVGEGDATYYVIRIYPHDLPPATKS